VAEQDNAPAWTGRSGAFEVWFLTCTDPVSGQGFWIRSTLTAPSKGDPHGAVWFARFDRADPTATFGIHRRLPLEAVKLAPQGFDVTIGDARFASGRLEGSIDGDGHAARWDLEFATGDPTYCLLPDVMYRGRLAPTKPYSPNVASRLSGMIEVDGRRFDLSGIPAQQGHLVGREHATRWAWAHCSAFAEDDTVVHALTAQGRRGPFDTPFLTSIGVRWQGRWIRLATVTKKRPFDLGLWRINIGNRSHRLTGRFEASSESLIRARYEDPNGTERWVHNSEVASCRLVLFERRRDGFEELALLESNGTTHAEFAGLTPARSVVREDVEVA
jgi:Tocopherol cyclase